MIYVFLLITVLSLVITFWKKKPIALTAPFVLMGVYMIVQIAMVPLPFFETVKFIFSLR
ncbi:hypothetical protein [Bacillus sp. FJAT-45350]|uniref:hypothetical protein n=1 Tax=Bacillus sp. FJAT-45350 TaxID=2011014 RepID=UPI0015CC534B|nr:hypothetical protein [Bacillus sp. FJAT-45350]